MLTIDPFCCVECEDSKNEIVKFCDDKIYPLDVSSENYFSLLYLQISTLIQHRSERPHVTSATSERTLRAIGRVGQAVNLAVERFVTVGETIADDNPDIKQDMYDACKEARAAGEQKTFIKSQPHYNVILGCVQILIKIREFRCRVFNTQQRLKLKNVSLKGTEVFCDCFPD